jgi:hypothetical protein
LGLPRGARIIAAGVVLAWSLFLAHKGLLELFPSLGADAEVAAAAQKATSAADRFIVMAKDASQTGNPPRQTDAAVGPLLDSDFDVAILRTKPGLAKADLDALFNWGMATLKVGSVYIYTGTGIDFTGGASDPKLLQQTDRNAADYAPEIGRYLDAQLVISGAIAEGVALNFSDAGLDEKPNVRDGKDKIRKGIASTINSAVAAFAIDGIGDDWRRNRLSALHSVAPKAAKLLTTEQCSALRDTSRNVGARMGDAAVKDGLDDFAKALKC